jgi:hypothetical protein
MTQACNWETRMGVSSEAETHESTAPNAAAPCVEHFEPHVGKTFHFRDTHHALVLDRVIRENENPFRSGERRPFTLIFRGPKEREVLPEGLYDCEIDGGPSFNLYAAPIQTPAPERQEYQAVFN